MAMKYVNDNTVQKNTNNLSHHVNTAKRVVKLMGIWKYAQKGDAKKVSQALRKNESPNVENEERRTPLHYGAEMGHIAVITVLLSSGANINARDMHGDTPMHCAIRHSQEEAIFFLMGRGCDLHQANTAGLTCWQLAEKLERRISIKMKEFTKCSNPSGHTSQAPPKPKPAAPTAPTQMHNPLLDQTILFCGQYFMYLRALPAPGTPPSTDPTPPPPYPPTPHDALKIVHTRWAGYLNELVLMLNRDLTSSPNFRTSAQSLQGHVTRQVDLTKAPITDGMIFNSLQADLFNLAHSGVEMLTQYEESMVSRAFSSHLEKITGTLALTLKDGAPPQAKWDPSVFVTDYVKLTRNVLAQLLYIADPDKSKKISDGLLQLSQCVKLFVESKVGASGGGSGSGGGGGFASVRAPTSPPLDASNMHVRTIADNLRKMQAVMSQPTVSSALFQDEEVEIFDSAIAAFNAILSLPTPVAFSAKRPILILLSEISYVKEAAFASPPDRDVLLNCALFIHCTCTRLARECVEGGGAWRRKEPLKSVCDNLAGLFTLCGNVILLVACALVTKNRAYHFVHIGYALRALASATALLVDPAYTISQ